MNPDPLYVPPDDEPIVFNRLESWVARWLGVMPALALWWARRRLGR